MPSRSTLVAGVGRALGVAVAAAGAAWGALALWLDGPASRPAAGLAAAAFLAAVVVPLVRPGPRAGALALPGLAFLAVAAWWLSLRPSNHRDWQPDVARTPTAEIVDGRVTLRDVRAFEYRSEADFDVRWRTRVFDLADVRGLDLFLSFWGPTLYGHTILSFRLASGPPLAVSIETRKERHESYSALRGFFRQYELVYVIADERAYERGTLDTRLPLAELRARADVTERARLCLAEADYSSCLRGVTHPEGRDTPTGS